VLNDYSEEELRRVFSTYGEIRNAKTLARSIVSRRRAAPIHTANGLKEIAGAFAPGGKEIKYLSRIFQALRIEVNEEMAALEEMLIQAMRILKPKGRLVVISYHSLEDRMVKHMMRYGNIAGNPEKDFYGNLIRPMVPVVRKPVTPTAEELERNSRARSAKLRIGERL
jgi:16S rRNA (cytosine1402-N4)-methyltransferase